MRVTVVSDAYGNIQSLSSEADHKGSAPATLRHVAKAGERVHALDVPAEYTHRPLADLHTELHVAKHGGRYALAKR
jgi:hypothetical protein